MWICVCLLADADATLYLGECVCFLARTRGCFLSFVAPNKKGVYTIHSLSPKVCVCVCCADLATFLARRSPSRDLTPEREREVCIRGLGELLKGF